MKKNNHTAEIIRFFATIYNHFSHFVDPTLIDLNRTYALANYYQGVGSNPPISINTILSEGTYIEERVAIEKNYNEAFNELKPLKKNIFEILLSIKSPLNQDQPVINVDSAVLLLLDLHKTLSVEKMHHFVLALFLVHDHILPGRLTQDFIMKWGTLTGKYFGLPFVTTYSEQALIKIRKFYDKVKLRQELSSLLYRIESHRLLLTDLLENHHA